jgi:hypothetical protein
MPVTFTNPDGTPEDPLITVWRDLTDQRAELVLNQIDTEHSREINELYLDIIEAEKRVILAGLTVPKV